MNSLQQSTASLDETRRKILYDLLKERHKNDEVTEDYILQEMNFYLDSIDQGTPILKPKPQGALTDAGSMNDEFSEYEIDIYSVYDQLNHISQRINQHQKLNESILNDVKLKVRKMDEKLREYDQLLRNSSAHAVFFETFIDSNSLEKQAHFYTDRDGTVLPSGNYAALDVHKNAIKLPVLYQENCIVNFTGLKLANIKITKQLGSGFIRTRNPEYEVDKAFDTSMETFWHETIMTDAPLEVDLGLEYYGINFGAVCELEINFDYISKVNEITFTPFVEYPVEIVSIHAYRGDVKDEIGYELVSPASYLKNQESTETISYQFPEIVCKKLKIVINQKHYVKQDILMEVEEKSMTDAWLQSQGHVEIDANKIFKPIYQDKLERQPSWFHLSNFLNKRDIAKELEKFKREQTPRKIQVSKYEYQYGFYNIAVNKNEYQSTGVYVTNPIVNANIHRGYLETVEEHPVLDEIGIPVTSIEYYLTDRETPGPEDWHPILPQNIKDVLSELLVVKFENGAYKAKTRFAIKKILSVRKNGRPLLPSRHYTMSGRNITIIDYDLSSVYTVEYTPDESAYYVDFLQLYTKNGKTVTRLKTDSFDRLQNGNKVILQSHPFIDKQMLNAQSLSYNPSYLSNSYLPMTVEVTLPDGQRLEQPVSVGDDSPGIVNVTDYFNPNVSLLEPFTGSNYQYRVVGNEVKFNTSLPAGSMIVVKYPYLTGPIRMKAIMRRNIHGIDGLTPFLHEYKVVFQSLV